MYWTEDFDGSIYLIKNGRGTGVTLEMEEADKWEDKLTKWDDGYIISLLGRLLPASEGKESITDPRGQRLRSFLDTEEGKAPITYDELDAWVEFLEKPEEEHLGFKILVMPLWIARQIRSWDSKGDGGNLAQIAFTRGPEKLEGKRFTNYQIRIDPTGKELSLAEA